MSNRNRKARLYPVFLILIIFLVWKYRQSTRVTEIYLEGVTMGTIQYHIRYLDENKRNFNQEIDSILIDFNQALSTYVPDSEISNFNKDSRIQFSSPYFFEVMRASLTAYLKTEGAFDPTVGPLVDAWGFGASTPSSTPDSTQVDSLLQLVGFHKIQFDKTGASKPIEGMQLNFGAIAKGQAVDVVGKYLVSQGVKNYMVEIGGEVRCQGKNVEDNYWLISIETPEENIFGQAFDAVYLKNQGMATSGNYRNFRRVNGHKVAHTIHPKTGFPQMQTLRSATILAPDCMHADAYATACMVLGLEKSKELIENDPDLEGYLIHADSSGNLQAYVSPGLVPYTIKYQDAQ